VLARLAQGESVPTIAAALGLTPGTVQVRLTRIFGRLPLDRSLPKREAAARWYREHPEEHPEEA
jgi:DNA-binding NarL/FixJ family response regulator